MKNQYSILPTIQYCMLSPKPTMQRKALVTLVSTIVGFQVLQLKSAVVQDLSMLKHCSILHCSTAETIAKHMLNVHTFGLYRKSKFIN